MKICVRVARESFGSTEKRSNTVNSNGTTTWHPSLSSPGNTVKVVQKLLSLRDCLTVKVVMSLAQAENDEYG